MSEVHSPSIVKIRFIRPVYLGHICANIGETGPGEPCEDGEMNDMTVDESEEKVKKVSRKNKFANVAKRCKWSQTVANGRKRSKIVAYIRKWPQTIANGHKWSQVSQMSQMLLLSQKRKCRKKNNRSTSKLYYTVVSVIVIKYILIWKQARPHISE